jgi:4-amino-4-deoxy-L-arabinose transferase-like glycosyltransferase
MTLMDWAAAVPADVATGHRYGALRRSRAWSWLRMRPEWFVAAALFLLLVATSGNYGFHRDELYFIVSGQHPDYGYPDQPLFTPLIVQALFWLGHGSIVVVRLASSAAAALTVVVVASIAGLFGGNTRARLLAALAWAVSAMSLVTGHMVSTTTFDVSATALVTYCLLRAILREQPRWVMIAGAVLGAGLLSKLLIGIVVGILIAAYVAIGPRRVLATWNSLWGVLLALAGVAPYAIWQSLHDWPQLAVSRAITQSGAEGGRVGVIPFQLLLLSPVLVPILISGIVRMMRTRPLRPFVIAYLVVLVFLILSSGKAYYAAGLLPAIAAAGAVATEGWVSRGAAPSNVAIRRRRVTIALCLAFAINAVIGLAILPPQLLKSTGIEALNPDAGEQVGWPGFVNTVNHVYKQIPSDQRKRAVIFASNYGEAGAVDVYGKRFGLPSAFSGHNAFSLWGPPSGNGPVILIGIGPTAEVNKGFDGCRVAAQINNGIGLDNGEQGAIIQLCKSPALPWSRLWPHLIHFD